MGDVTHPYRQHKIVILNPKGGSGKTTLSTNLASYFAMKGAAPVLVDCDPGGYSLRWLDKRGEDRPAINGFCGYEDEASPETIAREFPESKIVIVDLPAAQSPEDVFDHIYDASSILIPIVPSEIDIYSAAKFIANLLLVTQLDRSKRNLAIVANRVKQRTKSYEMLSRFLTSLNIPVVARIRDSQNFVHAASFGLGIAEMPQYKVRPDMEQLESITNWLERWRLRQLDALIAEEMNRIPDSGKPASRLLLDPH